ncbi:MAG TPA: hypothetical protein DDZ76_13890, partial [Xanthomonadales bacterium]|nr:hypothetical protein [Xanthomonadales bacterium]
MWGELFSLAAAATWAVGVILYRQLGLSLSPLKLNFLKNLLVLAALAPLALLVDGVGGFRLPLADLILALASGAIGIAVADTLYFRALNALGAGRLGILGNSYSPWIIVLSMLLLDERLSASQWLGFALVSAGVLLVVWPGRTPLRATGHGSDGVPGGPVRTGLAAVLGAFSIFLMALSVVMIKPTLEAQPLLPVTVIRMAGALIGMLMLAGLRGGLTHLWPKPNTTPWRRLAVAALFGQALSMVFWLAGYKLTAASVAAILN